MKVFVTGGSGFVGREIITELLNHGHSVRALVRNAKSLQLVDDLETVVGDTTSHGTWCEKLAGCDAVIHLVGIIREFRSKNITFEKLHRQSTHNVVQAAENLGVKRFLQMSANGTRGDAVTRYHQTKWEAEELVRQSGLEWTIFRPSLIFGPQDQFVNMLARLIKLLPVVPVMGDGTYRLQPVCVNDVSVAFVDALIRPETVGKTYHCCGPEILSYDQLLDLIAEALGQVSGVRKFHQPLCLMKPLVGILESIPVFPLTSDQLTMLLEENTCNNNSWSDDFGLALTDLRTGIAAYLK